jgi:hypothetical protein
MKKLALIMMFSVAGVVLSAEEYTIQTISTLKENSITPAFEKKVEKTALHATKKKEGECNIVTVGNYKSVKEAHADLKKAKVIAKDAFIRPIVRTTPKVCEARSAAAKGSSVENKREKTAVASVQNNSLKKEEAIEAVHEAVTPSATVATVDAHTGTVIASQETKTEPCKVQPCDNSPVFVYDRNLARKNDIQEAIEYYKRSPYYSFKPVLTLR